MKERHVWCLPATKANLCLGIVPSQTDKASLFLGGTIYGQSYKNKYS